MVDTESWMTAESVEPCVCEELDGWALQVMEENLTSALSERRARLRVFRTLHFGYCSLFVLGFLAFAAALVEGLMRHTHPTTVGAFGGLSAAMFVVLLVFRPLDALERSSIFFCWHTLATNSYWTRLMYVNRRDRVRERDLQRLEELTSDTLKHLAELLARHAETAREYPTLLERLAGTATPETKSLRADPQATPA